MLEKSNLTGHSANYRMYVNPQNISRQSAWNSVEKPPKFYQKHPQNRPQKVVKMVGKWTGFLTGIFVLIHFNPDISYVFDKSEIFVIVTPCSKRSYSKFSVDLWLFVHKHTVFWINVTTTIWCQDRRLERYFTYFDEISGLAPTGRNIPGFVTPVGLYGSDYILIIRTVNRGVANTILAKRQFIPGLLQIL